MEKNSRIIRWIIGVFIGGMGIIILTLVGYSKSGMLNLCNDIDKETIASFGAFIGGFVGVIFSVGTALLVYITYKSQREHLERQTEHINATEWNSKIQRFEDKFFRLLAIHESIKKDIELNSSDLYTGLNGQAISTYDYPKVFTEIANDFERFYDSPLEYPHIQFNVNNDDYHVDDIPDRGQYEDRIKYKYKFFFRHYEDVLGHYFRNVYHILKFIDKESEMLKQEAIANDIEEIHKLRKFYIDIFRSQLTASERVMIFYNSFSFEKTKKKLIKSRLLEDIKANLINSEHSTLYPEGYFKG